MYGDDEWLKVLSGEQDAKDAPFLPDERLQITTNGRSGRRIMEDAFRFKVFLRQMLSEHATPLSSSTRILDFGCGWGRTLRTFLNEVEPANLLGTDAQAWMLDKARETTKRDIFKQVSETPPTGLDHGSFDLIYAYSVFSHLSESTAAKWIREFEWLLAPNGLLCVTTRPRAHIEIWKNEKLRENTTHSANYANVFKDSEADLALYDSGQFVFHPGASHDLSDQHYGEAIVPAIYAERHWASRSLKYIGYFENYSDSWLQPVIVMQRSD